MNKLIEKLLHPWQELNETNYLLINFRFIAHFISPCIGIIIGLFWISVSNKMVRNRCKKLFHQTTFLEHKLFFTNNFDWYSMAEERKSKSRNWIGWLSFFIHTNVSVKSTANIFLHEYHIFEVWFPDITCVEYDRIIFKKLKHCITKNVFMVSNFVF